MGRRSIAEGNDEVLQPGMTFHLPIMFRVPRKFGVGLSETIAITEDGCDGLVEGEGAREVDVAGRPYGTGERPGRWGCRNVGLGKSLDSSLGLGMTEKGGALG